MKCATLVLSLLLVPASFTASVAATVAPTVEETRKSIYEGLGACDQAVFTNDDYFATSLRPLVARVGHVRIISLKNPSEFFDISTRARVSDIKIQGDIAYVLTGVNLEAWSISKKKQLFSFASHPRISSTSSWRQQASGFVLKGQQAIISHGTLGVSVLDLTSGEFVKLLLMPTVSSAQDIDLVDDDHAVLAVDNDDEGTFRGMYVLNLRTLEFTRQIKVDNAFPSAIRVLEDDQLMLVYFNAVWKFEKKHALSVRAPQPLRRAWQFPGLAVVDMQGKVAFDKKYLYGCFQIWDEQSGARTIRPMAFDLKSLKLN